MLGSAMRQNVDTLLALLLFYCMSDLRARQETRQVRQADGYFAPRFLVPGIQRARSPIQSKKQRPRLTDDEQAAPRAVLQEPALSDSCRGVHRRDDEWRGGEHRKCQSKLPQMGNRHRRARLLLRVGASLIPKSRARR